MNFRSRRMSMKWRPANLLPLERGIPMMMMMTCDLTPWQCHPRSCSAIWVASQHYILFFKSDSEFHTNPSQMNVWYLYERNPSMTPASFQVIKARGSCLPLQIPLLWGMKGPRRLGPHHRRNREPKQSPRERVPKELRGPRPEILESFSPSSLHEQVVQTIAQGKKSWSTINWKKLVLISCPFHMYIYYINRFFIWKGKPYRCELLGFPFELKVCPNMKRFIRRKIPKRKPKRSFKSPRSRWATFQSLGRPAILAAVVVSDLQVITSIATCIGEKPEVEKKLKASGVSASQVRNIATTWNQYILFWLNLGGNTALLSPGMSGSSVHWLGTWMPPWRHCEGTVQPWNLHPWRNRQDSKLFSDMSMNKPQASCTIFKVGHLLIHLRIHLQFLAPHTCCNSPECPWSFQFGVIHMLCILLFPAELWVPPWSRWRNAWTRPRKTLRSTAMPWQLPRNMWLLSWQSWDLLLSV